MIKLNCIIHYQNTMYQCKYIINYPSSFLDDNGNRFRELLEELCQKTLKTCFPDPYTFPITFTFFDTNQKRFTLVITKTQSIMTWNSFSCCACVVKNDFEGNVFNITCNSNKGIYIEITIDNIEDVFAHTNQYSGIKIGKQSIFDFFNM